jgi:hypothetical protein
MAWIVAGDFGDGMSIDPYAVFVFAKGTYDPTADKTGEPVTVNGKPGFYRAGMQCQCSSAVGTPGVVWEYAPDSWALVQYPRPANEPGFVPPTDIRETVLSIANAVRTDRSHPIRVPFRLGYLPARMRPTGPLGANVNTVVPGSKGTMIDYMGTGGAVEIVGGQLIANDMPIGEPVVRNGVISGEPEVVVNLGGYGVKVSGSGVATNELKKIGRSITGVADLLDTTTWFDAEDALQPR